MADGILVNAAFSPRTKADCTARHLPIDVVWRQMLPLKIASFPYSHTTQATIRLSNVRILIGVLCRGILGDWTS
jgi:hypothetical protein